MKDRASIVGRTGSGKTVAAVFQLLHLPIEDVPIVIYDYKGDDLIADIGEHELVHHIRPDQFPDRPGLWVVRPLPDEEDAVEEQLWRIWNRQWMGVFMDEGYMVSGSDAYRALLTQGRSLHIPVLTLSQRPVWMDKFSFTEASFYQVFDLNNRMDRQKMMEYIPADLEATLPPHHSFFHDVAANETEVLKPVPEPAELVRRYHERLDRMKPRRRVYVL